MRAVPVHVVVLAAVLSVSLAFSSFGAYPSEDITILEQKEITVLSDDQLIEAYINVLAEMEAARAFHATSGFTPREYKSYRETVKYRLRLLFEIHRRKIEIPAVMN